MKIVVLVKEVPDTYGDRKLDPATGLVDREASDRVIDEIGERALEAALKYKDANKDTEIVALSMGPATTAKALRKALAMGATSALHVHDDALVGADLPQTALALSRALQREGFDLILAGNESTDGRGGVVPAMIAEHLNLPHLTFMNSLEIAPGSVSGERAGEGCSVALRAALPAIASVTERLPEPRFPGFKGTMAAKRKPLGQVSAADLDLGDAPGSRVRVTTVSERPARSAGTKIIDEGDAGRKLADFLASSRLI